MTEKTQNDHLDWDNLTQPVPLNLIDSDFTYAVPEGESQMEGMPGSRSEILPLESVESLLTPPNAADDTNTPVTESLTDTANFQRLQAEALDQSNLKERTEQKALEEIDSQQQRLEQWMANARARLQKADQEPTAPGRPLRPRREPSPTMIHRVEMQKTMFEPGSGQFQTLSRVGEEPVEGFQDSSGYRTGKIDLEVPGDPMATLVVPRNTFIEAPPISRADKTEKIKAIERKVAQIKMTESSAETFFMASAPPLPERNNVRLVMWVMAGVLPIVFGMGLFALMQTGYLDGLEDLIPGMSRKTVAVETHPLPTPALVVPVPVKPAPVTTPVKASVKTPIKALVKAPVKPIVAKIKTAPKAPLASIAPSMLDMTAKAEEKTRHNIEASMLGVEVAKPTFGNETAVSTRGEAALRTNIQEAIQAYSIAIREIFDRFNLGSPDLQGDVVIGLTVHPNGHILQGSVSASSTGSAAFDQELLRNVLDWKIATFPDNRPRYVAIPFHFDLKTPL